MNPAARVYQAFDSDIRNIEDRADKCIEIVELGVRCRQPAALTLCPAARGAAR